MFYWILPIYIFNMIYVIESFYSTFKSSKRMFKVINEKEISTEAIEDSIKSINNKFFRVVFGIFIVVSIIIVIVFLIALFSSLIWVPIFIWVTKGITWGLISMVIGVAIGGIVKGFSVGKKINDRRWIEASIISDIIYGITIFMSGYIFTNMRKMTIQDMVKEVYENSTLFNETLMVLVPVIIIAVLLTNIYLLIKRTSYVINKDISAYKVTTKKQVFLVLVTSSFIGLFFFNEIDISYVSESSLSIVIGAKTLFLVLVSAIFIPTLLSVLQEKKAIDKKEIRKEISQMIKSNNDLFQNLYFIDLTENNTFKDYLIYKGVFLHKHVYEVLNQYRDKVTYKELSTYIKYDKGLRNVLYKYMSAVEEYYRSLLINNYDINHCICNLQKDTVKVDELVPSNKETSNLYKFTFSKKFSFSKLLDLLRGKDLIDKDKYEELDKIRDFRNKVMHHNLLILSFFKDRDEIEENIAHIENLCRLIYNALPDSMKSIFEININKCNHITNKNRIPNLDILCLRKMSNGIFK